MDFSVVTPSYVNDYHRCVLLNDSIQKHLPGSIRHHIIVDARDYKLFKSLASARTQVLTQEEIVERRFWPVPFSRKWRVTWNSPPIRGWIWQQLVKLSIARAIDTQGYLMIDSDAFFVRHFDPSEFVRDGLVPLMREDKPYYASHVKAQEWHRLARKVLDMAPGNPPFTTGYVVPLIFWRRDTLMRLRSQLTRYGGDGPWLRQVARTFSEYFLYGVFAEAKLGPKEAGHYLYDVDRAHAYWSEETLDVPGLRDWRDRLPEGKELVMINAKSETSVPSIRQVFFGSG